MWLVETTVPPTSAPSNTTTPRRMCGRCCRRQWWRAAAMQACVWLTSRCDNMPPQSPNSTMVYRHSCRQPRPRAATGSNDDRCKHQAAFVGDERRWMYVCAAATGMSDEWCWMRGSVARKSNQNWFFIEIALVDRIQVSCLIILKFCTDHSSHAAVVCAKFQNDKTTEKKSIDKRNYGRFEFKMDVEWIMYIVTTIWE